MTLFPADPNPQTLSTQQLFPGAGPAAPTALFGDSAALTTATGQAQQQLQVDDSLTGQACQSITAGANRSHPDLSQDPLWSATDQAIANLDIFGRSLADCTVTTTTQATSFQAHVPDYRTCERAPWLGTNRCTLTHTVTLNPLPPITVSVGTWGSVTNTFAFDLKDGAWRSVAPSDGTEFTAQVPVLDPAQVCPATARTRIQFRRATDWPDVPVGGNGDFDDTTDYWVLQTPACDHGLVGRVQLVDPGGPGWYQYAAHFEFEVLQVSGDRWGPDDCLATARLATDGFCTVTTRCTAPPDADGCAVIDGVRLCDHDQLVGPAPVPGIDPLCQAVQVEADCPFAYGALRCWTDPQGGQHCPENTAANTARTSCETLEQNPACGFIKSDCVAGAQGASGTCYVFTDTYDCGSDATVPTQTANSTYRCPGPVRCLGEDCVTPTREQNPDFARAAAAFQAAQAIVADLSCPPPEAAQGSHSAIQTCQIFKGEAMECKKAVGGQVNCCECPGGVSLADYVTLMLAALKLDSAITSWNSSTAAGQAIQGAWTTLREPIVQSRSTVTDLFTSAVESIGGSVTREAAGGMMEQISGFSLQQTLMNAAAELIGEVFGEAARDALFQCVSACGTATANYALTGLASTVASVLTVVMWVYMAYQIAKILIQIIWQCEPDELALGAKRELKTCHHVGSYCATEVVGQCIEKRESYCCFASPLSRILQEQIRPQLGLSWGSSKNPDCRGITVGELSQVDWSRVNLDEWLGILALSGRLPTTRDFSANGLTGTGNLLDQGSGTRHDTVTRTQERVDQVNVDQVRTQVGQDLWGNTVNP